MKPVSEPNEEVQLELAGPLPDELNKDAYILVAVDKMSKFPATKVILNTTADIAIKFMQRYISINGVAHKFRCNQAQRIRAKIQKQIVIPISTNFFLLRWMITDRSGL